jgi:hypothetical protein
MPLHRGAVEPILTAPLAPTDEQANDEAVPG